VFNPLEHRGLPVDEQLRSWSELNVEPYSKLDIHPYSRSRIILLNGIEVEAILFSHQFARHTDNPDVRRAFAINRRIEERKPTLRRSRPSHPAPASTVHISATS
jgi:hypothetical protein